MRLLTIVALLGVAMLAPRVSSQARNAPPDIGKLIALYDRGEFAAFEEGLRTVSFEVLEAGIAQAASGLPRRADVDPPVERARLVLAAVAVEGAARAFVMERVKVGQPLEVACRLVRAGRPSETERLWHRAVIAVLESTLDPAGLEVHVPHALGRFPGEGHFVLARAVAAELGTFPESRDEPSLLTREEANPLRIVASFEDARKHPAVRAEASARLAYLWLRLNRAPEALKVLEEFDRTTDDPYVRYLGFMMQGRAFDRLDRYDEAIAAYQRAVDVAPGGQTAAIGLMATALRAGRIGIAERAAGAALSVGEGTDPWLTYSISEGRHWSELRDALRQALR